jgi:O-antigen ligase
VGFARLLHLWRGSLHVAFAVLCLRYIHAVGAENGSLVGPLGILIVTSAGLGAWRPQAALLTFAVAMPLLNGLPILGVAGNSPSSVFAALWLGWVAQQLFCINAKDPKKQAGPPALPAALLAADLLITALLLSLGAQLWRHHHDAQFWTILYRHTAAGYGDPFYFLSSAFIWLQGLFWFRALLLTWQRGPWNARGGNPSHPTDRSTERNEQLRYSPTNDERPRSRGALIAIKIRLVFLSTAGLTAIFTLSGYKSILKDNHYDRGFLSAYEDIFSFGGIAVSIFVFTITILTKGRLGNIVLRLLYAAVLLSLVILSWSRGIWLAAVIGLFVVAWFRLPRWCTMVVLAMTAVAVGVINLQAKKPAWQNHVYLERLVSLVRIEKLADKSSGRLDLYHKAFGMIRERPLLGHGIGSFYLGSPRYAKANDPTAPIPNFAHNVFLQIAAEQGVVVAALFAGLIGWTLWRGVHAWQTTGGRQAVIIPGDRNSEERLTLLGTTLALGVYVQTNLTSNSLNIYASNQFFFWFLMAAVLGMTQGEAEKRELRLER